MTHTELDLIQFGDVIPNGTGDLLVRPVPGAPGPDMGILKSGTAYVTLEQASRASKYGWAAIPGTEQDGLVKVSRG